MSDPEEVFDLLADDYAREILAHADRKPMSAKELSKECDAHHTTIYRRIERLRAIDLINERLQVDPEGHHYAMYDTNLESMTVKLDDGEYLIRIQMKRDPVDRMANMWREIRGEHS